MQRKKGFRLITVEGKVWQYKIGRSNVVAFDGEGNKKLENVDVVAKGFDVARARWKKCQVLGPKEVADWLAGKTIPSTEEDPSAWEDDSV